MTDVFFWWIGHSSAEHGLLDFVRTRSSSVYERPVRLHHDRERPEAAFDPTRQQHSATRILDWLTGTRPPSAHKIVGITDVDLFVPIMTFVYGEAHLDGPAAVVSTARLGLTDGGRPDPHLLASRLAKECIHQLGHTFGLIHCSDPRCVMARSGTLLQVDSKGDALCRDCRSRYWDPQRRG